jgi:phospholipase/lecithinase/hemolysin
MKSLFATLALALAAPAAALTPTGYIVFGDSFLDAGNIEIGVGDDRFAPRALGYWQGRFSDGPTWVDYLSLATLGSFTRPALAGGSNFAFGGARAAGDDIVELDDEPAAIPGLPTQLGLFQLATFGQPFDTGALYIVNFGNNDVNAIQSGDLEGLTLAEYQAAYVDNIVGTVLFLNAQGAQNILVAGVPNPTEIEGQILQGLLDTGLDLVEPGLSANLLRFDYFDFFTALAADPTQFGLRADLIIGPDCLSAGGPLLGVDCSQYLSWDGIHVTKQVQHAIARQIAEQVGLPRVPEPATWALLVGGFGLVGIAMRRRRYAFS